MEPYLKSKEEVLKELLSSHEGLSILFLNV